MNADRKGNMSFAVIAVTILLLASFSGIAAAEYSKINDKVDDTRNGIDSIDAAVKNAQSYINQELGIIILDISRDDSLGPLADRADVFINRADRWIEDRFPMKSGDVTFSLIEKELELRTVPMEIVSGEYALGGYVPSYLHGSGTIKVKASSDYGSSTKDLTVSTDGSYALPLAAEQGSIFENMVAGGGISISQMLVYQLQSLAQYRVLNGYGAKSQYGQMGTNSIITATDVRKAYGNALEMVGILCFRDDQGGHLGNTFDLANVTLGKSIVIDASAFYGQVLASVMDDLALKWYDYLCGNVVLSHFEDKLRPYRAAIDSLSRFISGEDPFSAAGYIERVMESNGISPDRYRTPGPSTVTVDIGGLKVTVDSPARDVLEMGFVKMFNVHYSSDGNYLLEDIRYIISSAAQRAFQNGSDNIVVALDPSDGSSFCSQLSEALRKASLDLEYRLESSMKMVINEERSYDPFYWAIADSVVAHTDSIADTDTLRYRIEQALIERAGDTDDIDALLCSVEIDYAIHSYRSQVRSDLEVYELLRDVEGGGTNVYLDLLSEMLSFGLGQSGLMDDVEKRVFSLVNEICSNMDMNPYSGPIEMPDTGFFQLIDETGNITKERLEFTYSSDPVITMPKPVESKCCHITGFMEDVCAAYSTTFSFNLQDVIDYRIEGQNSLSAWMDGRYTSACEGRIHNDLNIEISVASAWALMGIEYSASDTIVDDAWGALYEYLEPILEPLREIMSMVMDTIEFLNRYLGEIAHYVTDVVADLFNRIMNPMYEISEWIDAELLNILTDEMLDVCFSLNLVEQKVGFQYLGYTFEIKLDLASMYASTKTLLVATLSGPVGDMDFEASITAKAKGTVNANNVYIVGKATVESDDWKVKMSLDPLMKGGRHLLTLSADIKGVDVNLVLPDLEDYNELGITLSRIPGVGEMLSNIPLPGLGVNVGLDAGISIKYTAPMATGLIINEFETNPPGSDKNTEWVELLNNSNESIDLSGYTLIASSDRSKKKMTLSGSIAPGEYLVIYPTFSMVNTAGKLTKNGEGLTLKDPDGNVVDKTGTRKDNNDDARTWQRSYDGSSKWEFKEGTQGQSNGSYLSSKLLTVDIAKEIISESVHDAFEKVDAITDVESLQEVIRLTVKSAVERVIKKIAGCLVEASVFLKVDVKDMTSTASTGVRIALRCDSDLVEDVLKYIAGQVESMALSMKNPYRIDPVSMFTDNIDLEVMVNTKIQYPELLARSLDELPKVDLGLTFRANLSAITQIFGYDTGRPGIECGIRIIDCPKEIIPGRMSPKAGMEHDLWLFRVNVEW